MTRTLLLALSLCACRTESRRATITAGSAAAPLAAAPAGQALPYFPDDTFDPVVKTLATDWYTKQLVALQEPPLRSVPADESVRLVWLRTFDKPITVRVSKRGSDFELVAVRGSGQGGYDPGHVELRRTVSLEAEDWSLVQQAMSDAGFATLGRQEDEGNDGAQWIVEHTRGGRYHLVERWSPKPGGEYAAFRALCDRMLQLAGPDVVEGPVY